MTKSTNPKKDQVLELLKQGIAPVEIAQRTGLPANTIRSWKSRLKKRDQAQRNAGTDLKRNATEEARQRMIESVECNEKLTPSRRDFCLHYAERPNASRAYRLAYPGCAQTTARTEGARLLAMPCIREEISQLKKIKREQFVMDPDDVLRLMWDIAFADMADFVEWGRAEVPVMSMYGPVMVEDPEGADSSKVKLTKQVNEVRFRESYEVDGTLLSEVKQGREGASVKMVSKERAIEWLRDYFEINPRDLHRTEFEKRRLAIEEAKAGALQQDTGDIIFQIVPPGTVTNLEETEDEPEDANDE